MPIAAGRALKATVSFLLCFEKQLTRYKLSVLPDAVLASEVLANEVIAIVPVEDVVVAVVVFVVVVVDDDASFWQEEKILKALNSARQG